MNSIHAFQLMLRRMPWWLFMIFGPILWATLSFSVFIVSCVIFIIAFGSDVGSKIVTLLTVVLMLGSAMFLIWSRFLPNPPAAPKDPMPAVAVVGAIVGEPTYPSVIARSTHDVESGALAPQPPSMPPPTVPTAKKPKREVFVLAPLSPAARADKRWIGWTIGIVVIGVLVVCEVKNRDGSHFVARELVQQQLAAHDSSGQWQIEDISLPDITLLSGDNTAKVTIAKGDNARLVEVEVLGRCLFGCTAQVRNLYFLGL